MKIAVSFNWLHQFSTPHVICHSRESLEMVKLRIYIFMLVVSSDFMLMETDALKINSWVYPSPPFLTIFQSGDCLIENLDL